MTAASGSAELVRDLLELGLGQALEVLQCQLVQPRVDQPDRLRPEDTLDG